MKKTLIPLTISLYLLDILFFIIGCVEADWLVYCYWGMTVLSLVLAFLNIIFAILNRKVTLESAVRNTLIFKLILIPHYIITFVLSIILVAIGIFSVFTLFWLASLPLLFIVFLVCCFTYFMMVSTSAHNIVALVRERKNSDILFVVVNVVLQFIFVLDVIDTAYLLYYVKNQKRQI